MLDILVPVSATTITKKVTTHSIVNDIVFEGSPKKVRKHEIVVRSYLELLIEDEAKFLRQKDASMGGMYVIRFKELIEKMKLRKLENIIQEKFGALSTRIFRILHAQGKLEEKNIAALSLTPQAEARRRCLEMFKAGFLRLQEVPKTTDRAPSRTFYFWYVELRDCYKKIIYDLYKCIGNIQARRIYETAARNTLIEKSTRSNAQKMPELLSPLDIKGLKDFEKVLEILDSSELGLVELLMLMKEYR